MLIQSIVFLAVPWVCLQFVNVVFPDHTHVLFEPVHEISNNVVCATSKASSHMWF